MCSTLFSPSNYEHSSHECSSLSTEAIIMIQEEDKRIFQILPLDVCFREIIAHSDTPTLFIEGLILLPNEDFIEIIVAMIGYLIRTEDEMFLGTLGSIIPQLPYQVFLDSLNLNFSTIKEEEKFKLFKQSL